MSILYLYPYLKDNPHLVISSTRQDMGCVIPHQSNAVSISHQTNAGLIKKTEFSLLHVGKINAHCKCKSVTYGLFCTFLFTYQLWYSFLGLVFINEKCFHNSKKSS